MGAHLLRGETDENAVMTVDIQNATIKNNGGSLLVKKINLPDICWFIRKIEISENEALTDSLFSTGQWDCPSLLNNRWIKAETT